MRLPTRICGPTDTDLAEYLREIRRLAPLTPEQERAAVDEFRRSGCNEARDRLVCGNLRLVIYVAKRYSGLGVPMQDLVEAGNLGLIQAVGRFDPQAGATFAGYAIWWIRRSILQTLCEQGRLIRLPDGERRARQACRQAVERLGISRPEAAQPEEVAREAGLPLRIVRSAMAAPATTRMSAGDNDAPQAAIADARTKSPAEVAIGRELRDRLPQMLGLLPGRQAMVVRMHFGLDQRDPMPLSEIARELGLPSGRAAHLLEGAIRRLQHLFRNRTAAGPPARTLSG